MYAESIDTTATRPTTFLSIPVAAELAGFSTRHFRRIIEAIGIPTVQLGRKLFILERDFQRWKTTATK